MYVDVYGSWSKGFCKGVHTKGPFRCCTSHPPQICDEVRESMFFSRKDLSKVFAFIWCPFYWLTNGRNAKKSSGRAGGRKCPHMFVTDWGTEASTFPCAAFAVRKGFSDSCPHCHRLATWQVNLFFHSIDSVYKIAIPATASPFHSPDSEATTRSPDGVRRWLHTPYQVGNHQHIFAKDQRKLRECAVKVQLPSVRPPNFPELHHPVLVAGVRIGLSCTWLYSKPPPGTRIRLVAQMLQVTLSNSTLRVGHAARCQSLFWDLLRY